MSYEPFVFGTCSICGKKYLMKPGSIYTVTFVGKSNPCCSYSCYMVALRTKEQITARREGASYKGYLSEWADRYKEEVE